MDLNSFGSNLNAAVKSNGDLILSSGLLSPQIREFLTLIILDANILLHRASISINDAEVIVSGEADLFGDGAGLLTAKFTITAEDILQIQVDTNPPTISLQTLAGFELLPDSIYSYDEYPDLTLTNPEIHLDSATRQLRLSGATTEPWKFLDLAELCFADLSLTMTVDVAADGKKNSKINCQGQLKLAGKEQPVIVEFPTSQSSWVVRNPTDIPLSSLTALGQLVGGQEALEFLPAPIDTLGNLSLRKLELRFAPKDHTWVTVGLAIGTPSKQSWPVIPGVLAVQGIALDLDVTLYRPEQVLIPKISIYGTVLGFISIGSLPLQIAIPIDRSAKIITVKNTEHVRLGGLSNLLSAMGADGLASSLPPDLDKLTQFTLTAFEVELDPITPSFRSFYVGLSADQPWKLPNLDWFALEGLALFMRVTDPTDAQRRTLSGLINGTLCIGKNKELQFQVLVEKSSAKSGWTVAGKLAQAVNLTQLVAATLDIELPSIVPQVRVNNLGIVVNTHSGEFVFKGQAEIDWEKSSVAGLPIKKFLADVEIQSQLQQAPKVNEANPQKLIYTGFFAGTALIADLTLKVRYDFKPHNKSLTLEFEGYSCTISKVKSDTLVSVHLGDLSLGDLVRFVARQVDPNADITLESPWDLLNDLNLKALSLQINVTQGSGGIWYDANIDLGFATIQSVGLFYQKATENSQKKSLQFKIAGQFLAKPYSKDEPLQWDALNGEKPPAVKGEGGSLFELRYFGIGRHVSFKDYTEITTVYDALDKLGNAFRPLPPGRSETTKPVASARSTPIDALDALRFNPDSNWLIGFDFTVLDTLTLGGVFNDPELYGLYIGLQGEKAKVFAGLSLQILYKKVSDTLGEYYLQLKLPTAMRQLEFGAVSVTLPIIDISIFTNGNFRIDCGFPRNGDYSRSGSIQAFPFTGTGGFYFGLLNGETSKTVPRITNGTFSPVLEFGFGLQLGVGKSIDKGYLSARFMVVVEGVLEGTLAFFQPNDPNVRAENYYRAVGRVRIVGQVSGSIDFTVISASVNIMVYASAAIALESYQPIQLYVEAGVSVALSIKILFFEVQFSFSATISESFTIGSVGTPPWQLDKHQPVLEPLPDVPAALSLEPDALPMRVEAADRQPVPAPPKPMVRSRVAPGLVRAARPVSASRLRAEALPAPPDEAGLQPVHQAPLQSWQWKTLTCWAQPREVELFFTPALTTVERTPHIVALLLIHHPPAGQADDAFVSLCHGMLMWSLSAYLGVQDTTAPRKAQVNAADLQVIYHRLTGTVPPGALSRIPGIGQAASALWEELKARGWLLDNGAISMQFQQLKVDAGLDLSAEFAAAAADVKKLLLEWPRPFGYQNLCDFLAANYRFTVQARPTQLPQNDENASALQAGILPMVPELRMTYTDQAEAIDFGKSLTCDQDYLAHVKTYLNLLTGTAEQRATSSIADSKQTVSEFVFRDYFTLVLQAVVQHSRDLLNRYPVTLQASDRLADIAGRYAGVSVASLALANQFDSKSWQPKAALWVYGVHHEVAGGETLSDVAKTRNQGFSNLALATANHHLPDMFQAAQTLRLAQLDYTVPRAATLGEIATRYATQVEQIVVQDTTVQQGQGPTGPIADRYPTPLSVLQISGIQFRVDAEHDTVDTVAAMFLVSPEAIQAANPTVDFTLPTLPLSTVLAIPALRYVVPPQTRQEMTHWFGVQLEDITAVEGGAVSDQADMPLPVNSRWTIRNAQYTLGSGDNLAGLASRLGVTLEALLTANPALQLRRGVRLRLPDFRHAVQSGETLNSIAALYDLPAEELAEHNRTTTGLFADQATWVAPKVTLPVADLLDILQQREHIAALHNIASTASRFLLHGLRLPEMGQTFPVNPQDWAQLTTQALYQLTQQQFATPAWLSTPTPPGQPAGAFTMALLNPGNLHWLNVEHSALDLIASERQQLAQLADAVAKLDVAQPQELSLYRPVKRSFTLQQSIVWHNAPPVPYAHAQGPQPQGGGPVLWLLPDTLQSELQQLQGSKALPLTLHTGYPDRNQPQAAQTTDVGHYQWATLLPLDIRPVDSTGEEGHVYAVAGLETAARRCLEQLLLAQPDSDSLHLYLLYPSNTIDQQGGGVESDPGPHETPQHIRLGRTSLLSMDVVPPSLPGLLLAITRDSFAPQEYFSQKQAEHPKDPDPWPFSLCALPLYTDRVGSNRRAAVILYKDTSQSYGGMAWTQTDASVQRPARAYKVTFWAVAKPAQGTDPIQIEFQASGVKEVKAVTDQWTQYTIILTDKYRLDRPVFGWAYLPEKNHQDKRTFTLAIGTDDDAIQYWDSAVETLPAPPREYASSARLTEPRPFLQLLREHSIAASGGCYLSYQTEANPHGLPAYVWRTGQDVRLSLLILSAQGDEARAWHNTLLTRGRINTQDVVFFAETAQCHEHALTLLPGQTGFETLQQRPVPAPAQPVNPQPQFSLLHNLNVSGYSPFDPDNNSKISDPRANPDKSKYQDQLAWIVETTNIAAGFWRTDQPQGAANMRAALQDAAIIAFRAIGDTGKEAIKVLLKLDSRDGDEYTSEELRLSTTWQRYEVPLATLKLPDDWRQRVVYPFGFEVQNTSPIRFAIDYAFGIQYGKQTTEVPVQIPETSLAEIYHLLGYRIAGTSDFLPSVEGLPVGPSKPPADRELDADAFYYRQVLTVPAPRNPAQHKAALDRLLPPPPDPYRAVGRTLQLEFALHDIYGNRLPLANRNLALPQYYYDALIPLTQWPNLTASYRFTGAPTAPQLQVLLDFAVRQYMPQTNQPMSGQVQRMAADRRQYAQIYHQLAQADVSLRLSTTIGGLPDQPEKQQILDFLQQIYDYLATVEYLAAQKYVQPRQPAQNPLQLKSPTPVPAGLALYTVPADGMSLQAIATHPEQAMNLFFANVDVLDVLGPLPTHALLPPALRDQETLHSLYEYATQQYKTQSDAELAIVTFAEQMLGLSLLRQGATLFLPPAPLSLSLAVTSQYAQEYGDKIFPLRVTCTLQRDVKSLHPQVCQEGMAAVRARVERAVTPVVPQMAFGADQAPLSLRSFARDFETTFPLKVALGPAETRSASPQGAALQGSERGQLWAVPLGHAISITPQDRKEGYFAPRPLANELLSRRAVPMRDYRRAQGLQAADPVDLQDVDLDDWGKQCLEAIDRFLAPDNAMAAQVVAPAGYQQLLQAKHRLAEAIADNVGPVIQRLDNDRLPQRLAAARAVLRTHLERSLGNAYAIDAIVQQQIVTSSPYREATSAPRLIGQPMGRSYMIGTQGERSLRAIARQLLPELDQAFPNQAVTYVARVLAQVQGIFTPNSDVTVAGATYTAQVGDSLQTVAEAVCASAKEPLVALATAIADQALLQSGKTLDLVCLTYPDTAPASLGDVADYFQVSLVDFMLANSDAPLQADQRLTETYTTGECDTVATLLERLADVLTQLPVAVSHNATLLQSVAGLRVLRLQSGYTLSSASLDLAAGTSYLTYVVNQSGATNRRLLLPLDYAIRGLEYDRVPVADMPGYYDRQWLSFVIPQAIPLGTLEIPLPLRAYPVPLTLVGQEARTATPAQDLTLEKAKTWAYRYTYTQDEKVQDAITASLAWNITDELQGLQTTGLTAGAPLASAAASLSAAVDTDLFTVLAQFIRIYPQMAEDLEALAQFDPTTDPIDAHRSVVQAFAQLVSGVADAWVGWNEARHTATQFTGRADFRCTLREFIDPTDHSLNIQVTPLAGRLPGAFALPLVIADARYWQPPEPAEPPRRPAVDGPDALESVTYRFRLQPDVPLPINDKQQRCLEIPGLNILQIQNARGGLSLSRNQDLLPGRTTHPDFVYQTPYLSFTNKLTPLVTLDGQIDIASIGTPKPQCQDTLVRHLSRLFQYFLELGPEASNHQPYRLQLACRYVYHLADGADAALATTVPILLQPAFTFQLTDWEITPPMLRKPSFVERLAARIQRWQAEHQPCQQGGAYVFDLSLLSSPSEESKLLNFLATNTTFNLPGATSRTGMPLSFYIPPDYWQRGANTQHEPYTLDNYTERVLAHYGADIYDVSTMQIACGLYPDFSLGMLVAKQWTQRLLRSFSGTLTSIRGWSYYLLTAEVLEKLDEETAKSLQPHTNARFDTTAEFRRFLKDMDIQDEQTVTQLVAAAEQPTFAYGGTTFFHRQDQRSQENTKPGAFFFRLIADQWFFTDPLTGDPEWPNQVMVNNDRKITWTDWKPITGENAWAGLVGPLQLAYLEHGGMPPYDSDGVQLALKVIPAYDAMQYKAKDGRRGAVYYAPLNTAANQAGKFVDPQGVSNENIFSSYAGLTMLMEILAAAAARETDTQTQQRILADFTQVKTIAAGIQDYLHHELYYAAGGHFYTGGSYSTAEKTGEQPGDFATPETSSPFRGGLPNGKLYPFAVDVHTWGCSVLGADQIDDWFGDGTAYKVWQQVKGKAGYYANGDTGAPILGVGYTHVPDPTTPEGKAVLAGAKPHAFIISAEWSFGAIVMCQALAEQYRLRAQRHADDRLRQQQYLRYASALERDADSMIAGVRYILLDTSRADQDLCAYYYANRRYAIPFGWYSNRVDSLCATAWALMVRRRFNPFVLGGSYQRSVIDPAAYTVDHTPWSDGTTLRPFDPLQAMGKAGIPREQQKLLHFLVVNNTHNLDRPDSQSRTGMPLSFYAPPGYWEQLPGYAQENRHPTDPELDNEDAVVERALIHYGVNIYDAATMQIAFAIFPQFAAGMEIANAQTKRLLSGFAIPNTTFVEQKLTRNPGSTIRGWTNLDMPPAQQFFYGKDKRALFPPQGQNNGPGAYFFRSIVDQFVLTDPLTDKTTYRAKDPKTGKVTDQPIVWVDWKPITGENAWAAMIGPLQLAYSAYGGMPPLESDAVRLALTILPAYEAMEAPDGGLFYAPWNMAGNVAGTQADALSLSHENNFSSYAGLVMLRDVLLAAGDTTHLPLVEHLIARTEHHFATHLYDARNTVFITSGTYDNPLEKFVCGGWLFSFTGDDVKHVQQGNMTALCAVFASHDHALSADPHALTLESLQPNLEWQVHDRSTRQSYHLIYDEPLTTDEQGHPVTSPDGNSYMRTKTVHVYGEAFAVDVQTWGSTVLGVHKIDSWFGTNRYPDLTAYALWQTTKQRAGYFRNGDPNDDIWGVGYTDVPTAAEILRGEKPHAFIISTEWTLGAINNCLVLAAQYDDPTSPYYNPLFATSLRKDADTMLTGINTVLLDTNSRSRDTEAYYYANRRYRIPFGWYANRIDSLCSNAWAIMVANRFNPFALGGSYTHQPTPPLRTQVDHGSQPLLQLRQLRLRLEDITKR